MSDATNNADTSKTKSAILDALRMLAAPQNGSKMAACQQEAQPQQHQTMATAAQDCADSIVQGLADLQLHSDTLNGFTAQLTCEAGILTAEFSKQAKRDAYPEANLKANLEEWQRVQQSYELQIQLLEARIQKQSEQISALSLHLQSTLRQAQDLAMRAFDNCYS